MALLKDGTRIYGTLYANTEVVIGSMNVASQINASFLQANSANILAQAAFNTSNTAVANTIYTQGVDATQNTNITAVNTLAGSAYTKANSANVLAQAAFDKANTAAAGSFDQYARDTANVASSNTIYTQGVDSTQNTNITAVNTFASSGFNKANSANLLAQAAFDTANTKLNITGGTITGDISFTGANVALGNVANVHIYGGNTGQLLTTDNLGNLSFIDLPTPNTVTYTANSLIQTNGVYVSGNLWSTQVFGDYGVANGTYVLTDGTGSAPAWYINFDFIDVVKFNRVVMNINYTQASGHTIYVQLYNYLTSAWDNIGTYTGLGSYYAFALEVIDETNYVNAGQVQLKLYHSNAGNVSHQTSIDYIALEQSYQGPQGPRGPTGSTGPTGATGNGVSSGGTSGQVLIKNSSANYDTTWSNNLIDAWNTGNAAFVAANAAGSLTQGAYNQANVGASFVNTGGTVTGNVLITKDLSVTGNLYILGNTTSINTSSFTVQDSLIVLGLGNYTTDILDIGFAGHYNNGVNAHAGIIRDASEKEFFVFEGYTPELDANNNINLNDDSFRKANLNAGVFKGNLIGSTAVVNGINLYDYTTSGYAKANSVGLLSQAGFDAANTAAANTVYNQGVNLTQNTNIDAVNTYATGAYDKANSANVLAQDAYNTANTNSTNITNIQGVNLTQNTNISSVNTFAGSAYDKANTTNVLAQAAFDKANTGISVSIDQSARDTANLAAANTIYTQGVDANQNTEISIIQGVNTTQNDAITILQGVNTTQNTDIGAVNTYATSAYGQANIATGIAQAAFNTVNTAVSNIAYTQGVDTTQNTNITSVNTFAGSAYDKANNSLSLSGGTIAGNITANNFSANIAIYTPKLYSPGSVGLIEMSDIGIISINPSGGSGAGVKFVGKNIEVDKVYSGSYGGNYLSLANETKLTSDRYDSVKIVTGINGNDSNIWNFANNQLIFPDNTYQNTAFTGTAIDQFARNTSNSVGTLAQAAFDTANNAASGNMDQFARDTANTASANTIYTQGVDTTQNTNITSVNTFAGSAYNQANTGTILAQAAFDAANTAASGNMDQFARDKANSAASNTVYTQGVDVTQNNSIQIIQGVDLGQNAAITMLQGVNLTQNTNIDAVNTFAGSAYGQANAAFTQANIGATFISSGGTVTGNVTFTKDVNITGNLYVLGNTTTVNTNTISVQDTLVILGVGNYTTDILDIGFAAHYNNGTNAHTGFIRDASTKDYYIFDGYTPELSGNNNIDIGDASFRKANLNVDIVKGNLIASTAVVNGLDLYNYTTNSYAKANTVGVLAQAAFDKANTGSSSGADQFARDTANSKTYTFYQNTAPATSNAHDLWVNSNTGVVYENFGSTSTPVWAEFGPSAVSNTSNVYINTLDRLSNLTSSLVLNNDGSLKFNNGTIQTTAYTGFGIDNVARTTANAALANTSGTFGGSLTVDGSLTVSTSVTSNSVTTNYLTINSAVSLTGATNLGALIENVNVINSVAPANTTINVLNSAINYYTSNCTQNTIVNITGNNITTLNVLMPIGKSISTVLILPQGSTPYIPYVIQIDNQTVTPSWATGNTIVTGNLNSTDIYTFTVIKTADAVFKVYASQSKYSNIG